MLFIGLDLPVLYSNT